MCKNLPVLKFPNEEYDLILKTDVTMSIGMRYSKSKKEKNSISIAAKSLIKQNAIIP